MVSLINGQLNKLSDCRSKKKKNEKSKKNKATDTKQDKGKSTPEKVKSEKKTNKNNKEEKSQDELKTSQELLKQEAEKMEFLKCFSIVPNMFIEIPPHGNSYFEVIFQPNKRMCFNEKIYFETQDRCEALCVIKGSSIAPEFSLDTSVLSFPGVIVGGNTSLTVILKNTGDTNGSFKWIIDDKRNIFDIEPKQGFVMPRNDFKMHVTFAPKQEKCQFKVKAKCVIKEVQEPLQLTLKGNSIKMPNPVAEVVFDCIVREQISKTVSITNTSSEIWHVKATVSNENFSTARENVALPQCETQIIVTYSPKVMTQYQPHKGTLFLQLPNGGAILYTLVGTASPPLVHKKIEKEISCKKNHHETLFVENWSNAKQTFDVTTELTSPVTTRTLFKTFGFKTIQVEGMETKKYRWGVHAINEGPLDFKVTFKNSETGEYLFFEISLKVLPCEAIGTLVLRTSVRKPVTKWLCLENPVDVPVVYALECPERNVVFEKSVKLEPYTATKLDVTYNPLQSQEVSTTLNARCDELGTFPYVLALHASPPDPEDDVTIKAELGGTSSKTVLFKNEFVHALEFVCKFDHEVEFHMARCNSIQPGEIGKIIINFEPSSIGKFQSKLYLTSPVSGEYVYNLIGEGLPPTPKGPFLVRPGYPTPIEFKNPYNEERKFSFHVHSVAFYTDHAEEVVKARRAFQILVQCSKETETVHRGTTGKLTVHADDEPDLKWTYYLQT